MRRQSTRHRGNLSHASPFTIDGKAIACPNPPRPPSYRRNPDVCFHWPTNVRLEHRRSPFRSPDQFQMSSRSDTEVYFRRRRFNALLQV